MRSSGASGASADYLGPEDGFSVLGRSMVQCGRCGVTFEDARFWLSFVIGAMVVVRGSRTLSTWEVSPAGGVQEGWWWVRQGFLAATLGLVMSGLVLLVVARVSTPAPHTSGQHSKPTPRPNRLSAWIAGVMTAGTVCSCCVLGLTQVLCSDLFRSVGWWTVVGVVHRGSTQVQGGVYGGKTLSVSVATQCVGGPGDFAPPFYLPFVAAGFLYPIFLFLLFVGLPLRAYAASIVFLSLLLLLSSVISVALLGSQDATNLLAMSAAVAPTCVVALLALLLFGKSVAQLRDEQRKRRAALNIAKQRSITAICLGQLAHDVSQAVHCAMDAAENLQLTHSDHLPLQEEGEEGGGGGGGGGGEDDGENDAQDQWGGNLRASLHLASRLLADSLDLAALAEGRLRLDPLPTRIVPILQQLRSVGQGIGEAKVRLHVRGVEEVEGRVLVDAIRLEQIVLNALSNAAKHAPPDSIIDFEVNFFSSPTLLLSHLQQTSILPDPSAPFPICASETLSSHLQSLDTTTTTTTTSTSVLSTTAALLSEGKEGGEERRGEEKGERLSEKGGEVRSARSYHDSRSKAHATVHPLPSASPLPPPPTYPPSSPPPSTPSSPRPPHSPPSPPEVVWMRLRILDQGKGLKGEEGGEVGASMFRRFEQQTDEVRVLVEEKMLQQREEEEGEEEERGREKGVESRMRSLDRLKGRGLGLSMVAKLVGLMKGAVALRNRKEGGAEFDLVLPLQVAPHSTSSPYSSSSASTSSRERISRVRKDVTEEEEGGGGEGEAGVEVVVVGGEEREGWGDGGEGAGRSAEPSRIKPLSTTSPSHPPSSSLQSTTSHSSSNPHSSSSSSSFASASVSASGSSSAPSSASSSVPPPPSSAGADGSGGRSRSVRSRRGGGRDDGVALMLGAGEVLVADDQPLMRQLLRRGLEREGAAAVKTFADGEGLVEYVTGKVEGGKGEDLRLILSDVDMGSGMMGFDVARSTHALLPTLPIILVSANTSALSREMEQEIGVATSLRKPFSQIEFKQALAKAAKMNIKTKKRGGEG